MDNRTKPPQCRQHRLNLDLMQLNYLKLNLLSCKNNTFFTFLPFFKKSIFYWYINSKVLLRKDDMFTILLKPKIKGRKKLILDDRELFFNVSLQLLRRDKDKPLSVGAEVSQSVSNGYFIRNPTIALRWPITYKSLARFDSPFNLVDPRISMTSLLRMQVNISVQSLKQ